MKAVRLGYDLADQGGDREDVVQVWNRVAAAGRRAGHWTLIVALVLTAGAPAAALAQDPTRLADPFIGSEGGGNTVPGASVPFGFVNASPDTTHGDTSGYDGWSPLVGFSAIHVSGTGGNSKYGNFRVTPTTGPVDPKNLAFSRRDEAASPGYYRVDLANGVAAELTATRMVAVERFAFPAGAPGNILIDVTSAVQLGGGGPRSLGGQVETHADGTVSGWASFRGGWTPTDYKLYFFAVFDRAPLIAGTWTASQGHSTLLPGIHDSDGGDQSQSMSNRLGTYASFDPADGPVVMKLAVSFVSEDRARQNMDEEAAARDFDTLHAAALKAWRGVLSTIEVSGGSDSQQRQFYSALYRIHTMPHDVSGDNPWWESQEPHYEDFYTLWDTFRGVHPLLTLIEPQRQRDMIRSLLDTYSHDGWLPDARVNGVTGLTQGGSNGDVVIADAIVKDLGGFDKDLAYAAIVKDGDVDSPDPMRFGRTLKDYGALGYMSLSETRSASRTMEYAYDDFAISEVAAALGHKDDAARFLARSGNWRHLWDDSLKCVHPRYDDGAWLENYSCDHRYPDATAPWWDHPYYEGNGYQYSTFVPQDVAGLIDKLGGRDGFSAWLDAFFASGNYDQGNEPDMLAPWLYIHAGRPDRTDERVRRILGDDYHMTHAGLPGNDDAGAMSAWYVWGAIGLFPNAGQPFYYIGSPLFVRTTIHLEGGRTFVISAPQTSAENLYVTAATLNGRPLDRAWLKHEEIVAGGVLELTMGPKPGMWAGKF